MNRRRWRSRLSGRCALALAPATAERRPGRRERRGARRQRLERAPDHHRHPARGSPRRPTDTRRTTSPHIDALAQRGTLFEQAYTYWPKTRGSFVAMLTGRRPSQNGLQQDASGAARLQPHPGQRAEGGGLRHERPSSTTRTSRPTLGYAKGFDAYRETWEEPALETRDATGPGRSPTAGVAFLQGGATRKSRSCSGFTT